MIDRFEAEPRRTALEVAVIRVETDERGGYVVLDDTILYPEGGGQPADQGTLDGQPVRDVQRVAGEIRHYLEASPPAAGIQARLELDWRLRFDRMQQHTAQHLITAIASDRFGWQTTSFHLGRDRSDIELDAEPPDQDRLAELEAAVASETRAARAVRATRVDREDPAAVAARSRGLPEGHTGSWRLIDIDGIDVCACGGTHLDNTAEIETVKLLGAERMRGGCRLHWIAGGRVRRLLGTQLAHAAELRELVGAGDDEMIAVIRGRLDRLREAERRARALEGELAAASAAALLASPSTLIEAHFEDAGAGYLQQVGRRIAAAGSDHVALLTGSDPGGASFLLVRTAGSAVDVAALGARIASMLAGRGGGRGEMFQGKAGSLDARAQALEVLAAALG